MKVVQGDENICCFTCISDVIFSLSCFTVLKRKHSYDYQWSKCQKYIWVVLSLAANLMKTENFLFVARSFLLPTNDASKFSHKSCLQMSAVENNFCRKLDQIKFLSIFCHLGSSLKGKSNPGLDCWKPTFL